VPGTGLCPFNIGWWKDESATAGHQTLTPEFRGREMRIKWEWH
jgi:hypothetical protein